MGFAGHHRVTADGCKYSSTARLASQAKNYSFNWIFCNFFNGLAPEKLGLAEHFQDLVPAQFAGIDRARVLHRHLRHVIV
jgi:hypothetical protein